MPRSKLDVQAAFCSLMRGVRLLVGLLSPGLLFVLRDVLTALRMTLHRGGAELPLPLEWLYLDSRTLIGIWLVIAVLLLSLAIGDAVRRRRAEGVGDVPSGAVTAATTCSLLFLTLTVAMMAWSIVELASLPPDTPR